MADLFDAIAPEDEAPRDLPDLRRGDPCTVIAETYTAPGVVIHDGSPCSRLVQWTPPGAATATCDWFDAAGGLSPVGKRLADHGKPPMRIEAP